MKYTFLPSLKLYFENRKEDIILTRLRIGHSRPTHKHYLLKADMKSYIPLETAAIFFLANLFQKQGISSEYVTADFICMGLLGLQGAKTENYKMKNSCPYRDSNSRPLILKSSAFSMRLSSLIYKREFKTSLVE